METLPEQFPLDGAKLVEKPILPDDWARMNTPSSKKEKGIYTEEDYRVNKEFIVERIAGLMQEYNLRLVMVRESNKFEVVAEKIQVIINQLAELSRIFESGVKRRVNGKDGEELNLKVENRTDLEDALCNKSVMQLHSIDMLLSGRGNVDIERTLKSMEPIHKYLNEVLDPNSDEKLLRSVKGFVPDFEKQEQVA